MSGYLQRIVGQAKAPATAIRPIVGSLYAASAVPQGLHSVQTEGIAHSTPQNEPPSRPAASQPLTQSTAVGDSGASREDRGGGATHDFVGALEGSLRIAPFMPERPEQEPLVDNSRWPRVHEQPSASHTAEFSANTEGLPGTAIHTAEGSLFRRPQSFEQPFPQPLMPRQLRSARSEPMPVAATSAPAVADEVHIHIGRIEVLAVTQAPAARPAPRAARRGFSLDEYLRNSDGRAR